MAATPETKVKAVLSKRLASLGVLKTNDALIAITGQPANVLLDGWYYMPSTNGYGESGVWDYVGCYRGKFFAIETKAGKNTLSAHQKIKGRIFQACNVLRYVVASVEEAENFSFEGSPQYQHED